MTLISLISTYSQIVCDYAINAIQKLFVYQIFYDNIIKKEVLYGKRRYSEDS